MKVPRIVLLTAALCGFFVALYWLSGRDFHKYEPISSQRWPDIDSMFYELDGSEVVFGECHW